MKIIHKNKKHYLLAICEDGKCKVRYTDKNLAFEAWHEHNENDDILFWKDNGYWHAWSVKTGKVGNNVSLIRLLTEFGQPRIAYVDFLAICGEYLVDPLIAKEDELVRQSINEGDLTKLKRALEENF